MAVRQLTVGVEMSNHPIRERTTGTARNGEIRLPWERFTAHGDEHLLLINGLGGPMVEYDVGFIEEVPLALTSASRR